MADFPNLHMPDVTTGEVAPAAAGVPVPDGYGHTAAPTTPAAQAANPGAFPGAGPQPTGDGHGA